MIRRVLSVVPGLLAALLLASVALAALGDHISGADFDSTAANAHGSGLAWDGDHFRVSDTDDDKIYSYTFDGTYTRTEDFRTGNTINGYALAWEGTYLYLFDGQTGTDRIRVYTQSGTYVSGLSFSLPVSNTNGAGVTHDGALIRVVDSSDDKVYSYNSSGDHISANDFDLAEHVNPELDNANPSGITWDGSHFWVVDNRDDKVYSYNSFGEHVAANDFDLIGDNSSPTDIEWDDTYLRVLDTNDRIYTYEGTTSPTPPGNYGLSEENRDFAAALESEVVTYGDWKCLRSLAGETVTVSNADFTVHGFCAKPDSGGNGMEIEIHLPSDAKYADLTRFADVTGNWWFVESGVAAQFNLRIYDDTFTTEENTVEDIAENALAFTEAIGGLEEANRLGFTTMAKSVSDDDCAEGDDADGSDEDVVDKAGFDCSLANLASLSAGDDAVLLFTLLDINKIEFADTPTVPESLTVTRNDEYTTATLSWELYDAVTLYEVQRTSAVQVDVADASRIEYGDPVAVNIEGTAAGVDEYEDATIEAHRTYQYRMRARGAGSISWSSWTEYVFSGATPEVDIQAPGNLEIARDADSIIASWAAPVGELDNYTLQRQELVVAQGTTFFGNVVTLGDDVWLPGNSTMYADSSILPTQIYEYRVAAVLDNQVGTYTDWFRIGPQITNLGAAPENFRVLESGNRILDERREFWMAWDPVPTVDDYEVQVLTFDLMTGGQTTETRIVTDPTFFQTSFGRVGLRVRGRKLDADICSTSPDDRCLSHWTSWYQVKFSPAVTIPSPDLPDDTADTSIMELRVSVATVLEATLEPAGAEVNPYVVMEFGVLVAALVAAILSMALSWKRGMAPLGAGMGAAIAILILFLGYRLLGTAVAWPIAAQFIVAVLGLIALVRQTGVFR